MAETTELEAQIKELERQLAVKNAYLSVEFTFPRGNKIPEEIKEQVKLELKKACTQLAENLGNVNTITNTDSDRFTAEEIKALKMLASVTISKTSKQSSSGGVSSEGKTKPEAFMASLTTPANTVPKTASEQVEKSALLVTLENVEPMVRKKMGANEKVFVKSVKGQMAFVINHAGQGFNIPLDDLEFT